MVNGWGYTVWLIDIERFIAQSVCWLSPKIGVPDQEEYVPFSLFFYTMQYSEKLHLWKSLEIRYFYESQEAERKRIASDLHDDIGSILSATKIYLSLPIKP